MAGVITFFVVVGVLIVLPVYVAERLTTKKGRRYGWVWGVMLGWIGVLVVLLLADKSRPAAAR